MLIFEASMLLVREKIDFVITMTKVFLLSKALEDFVKHSQVIRYIHKKKGLDSC